MAIQVGYGEGFTRTLDLYGIELLINDVKQEEAKIEYGSSTGDGYTLIATGWSAEEISNVTLKVGPQNNHAGDPIGPLMAGSEKIHQAAVSIPKVVYNKTAKEMYVLFDEANQSMLDGLYLFGNEFTLKSGGQTYTLRNGLVRSYCTVDGQTVPCMLIREQCLRHIPEEFCLAICRFSIKARYRRKIMIGVIAI